MIGFYFFFLLGVWTVLIAWLSVVITKRLPDSKWRSIIGMVLFALLLPMVLIDEMVGKLQFEKLCQENSTIYIAPDAKGRTVYLANIPEEYVGGTWVRIWEQKWRYIDATTGETIVSYNTLAAGGGWFVRTFYYEHEGPFLFRGAYSPPNRPVNVEMFQKLGINRIDRPKHNFGESK